MTGRKHLDTATVEPLLTWLGVMAAIEAGSALAGVQVHDTLLRRGSDSMLSRSAMIDGLGSLVKSATVFPANADVGMPSVNGAVTLFSDSTGEVDATIDFHLLTRWKTAADSAVAANRLARPDSEQIVILGSGAVAASMVDAYRAVFPAANVMIWSRTIANATRLADAVGARVVDDLELAVRSADIICTATMSSTPVVFGHWLQPGQHVDLIGGYRSDMRETDDDAMARATVFVDCVQSALDVGDITGPIASGLIDGGALIDFGGIASGAFARTARDQITICKNAGGAHLDLMVARHMYDLSND